MLTKLRNALLSLALVQVVSLAADQSLLSLVMPDAKVIAGADVDSAKTSPFGVYVLSKMQPDDPNFLAFVAATGFDPRQDVSQVMIASNAASSDPSTWLVLVKGRFDIGKIEGLVKASGGTITTYKGVDVITIGQAATPGQNGNIAFLDPSTAAIGLLPAVQSAIDRRQSGAAPSGTLVSTVQQASNGNDFWFATLVPLSQFAAAMPDPNLSGLLKGNVMQSMQQASGGIKFGANVRVSGQATMRSPQDASSLVDVVKFIAGLIQTNASKDTTAAQVSTLVDALQASAQGNVATISLTIPEATLEQMLDTMRQQHGQAQGQAKKPATRSAR